MKVIIDGREYSAATAVALIDEIKGLRFDSEQLPDTESYIEKQQEMHMRIAGKKMVLPQCGTEERAVAMFEAIHAIGAWKFEKGEAAVDNDSKDKQ